MYKIRGKLRNIILDPVSSLGLHPWHWPWCETPGFHPWNRCGQRCRVRSSGWSPWVAGHAASPSGWETQTQVLKSVGNTWEREGTTSGFSETELRGTGAPHTHRLSAPLEIYPTDQQAKSQRNNSTQQRRACSVRFWSPTIFLLATTWENNSVSMWVSMWGGRKEGKGLRIYGWL